MNRLTFLILNIIITILSTVLLTTYTNSIYLSQNKMNKIISTKYKKEILKKVKDSKEQVKQLEMIHSKTFVDIVKLSIEVIREGNKDIIPFTINNNFKLLNNEEVIEVSKEMELFVEKQKTNFLNMIIISLLLLSIHLTFYLLRLYSYYGRNRYILGLFIYMIPLSSIYYIIRAGKNQKFILENKIKNKIKKSLNEEDLEKMEEKYKELINKEVLNVSTIKDKIIIAISSIKTVYWIKYFRRFIVYINYVIGMLFFIYVINYILLEVNTFLINSLWLILLSSLLHGIVLIIDNIQYKKILMLK